MALLLPTWILEEDKPWWMRSKPGATSSKPTVWKDIQPAPKGLQSQVAATFKSYPSAPVSQPAVNIVTDVSNKPTIILKLGTAVGFEGLLSTVESRSPLEHSHRPIGGDLVPMQSKVAEKGVHETKGPVPETPAEVPKPIEDILISAQSAPETP